MAASRHLLRRAASAESGAPIRGSGLGAGDSLPDSISFSVIRKLCRTRKGLQRILQVYQTQQSPSLPSPRASPGNAASRIGDTEQCLLPSPDALVYVAQALCRSELAGCSPSAFSSSSSPASPFSPSHALKRAQLLRGRQTADVRQGKGTKYEESKPLGEAAEGAACVPHVSPGSQPTCAGLPSSSLPSSLCQESSVRSSSPLSPSSVAPSSSCQSPLVDAYIRKEEAGSRFEEGGEDTRHSAFDAREDDREQDLALDASVLFRLRGFSQASPTACLSPLAAQFLIDHALLFIDKGIHHVRRPYPFHDPDSSSFSAQAFSSPASSTSTRRAPVATHSPQPSSLVQHPLPSSSLSSFSPANYSFLLFSLSFSPSHSLDSAAAIRLLRPLPALLPQFSLLDLSQTVAFMTQLPRLLTKESGRRGTDFFAWSLARGLRHQPTYRVAFSPGEPILTVLPSPPTASPSPLSASSSTSFLSSPASASSCQPGASSSPRHKLGPAVSVDWFLSLIASRLCSTSLPLLPFDPTSPKAPIDALKHATLILSAFSSFHYTLRPALVSLFLSSLFQKSTTQGAHGAFSFPAVTSAGSSRTPDVPECLAVRANRKERQGPTSAEGEAEQGEERSAERRTDMRKHDEDRTRVSSVSSPAFEPANVNGSLKDAEGSMRNSASSHISFPDPLICPAALGVSWRIAGETLPFSVAAKCFLALATQCALQAREVVSKRNQMGHLPLSPLQGSSGISIPPEECPSFPSPLSQESLPSRSSLPYGASRPPPASSSPSLSSSLSSSASSSPSASVLSSSHSAFCVSASRPSIVPPLCSSSSPPLASSADLSGTPFRHQRDDSACLFTENLAGGVAASLATSDEERHLLLLTPSQTRDTGVARKEEGTHVAVQMEALMRHLLSSVARHPALRMDGEALADCVDGCAVLVVSITVLLDSVYCSSASASDKECPSHHSLPHARPRDGSSIVPPRCTSTSSVQSRIGSSLASSMDYVLPFSHCQSSSLASPSELPTQPSLSLSDSGERLELGGRVSSNVWEADEERGGGNSRRNTPEGLEERTAVWLETVKEKLAQAASLLSRNARPHRRQKRAFLSSSDLHSTPDTSDASPSNVISPSVSYSGRCAPSFSFLRPAASPSSSLPRPSSAIPFTKYLAESPCHRWPSFCFLPLLRGRVQLRLSTTPALFASLLGAWAQDPHWSTSALFHLIFMASSLQSSQSCFGDCRSLTSHSVVSPTQTCASATMPARPDGAHTDTKAETSGDADRQIELVGKYETEEEKQNILQGNQRESLRSGALVALLNTITQRLKGEETGDPSHRRQRGRGARPGREADASLRDDRKSEKGPEQEGHKTCHPEGPGPTRLHYALEATSSLVSGCTTPRSPSYSSHSPSISSTFLQSASLSPPQGKRGNKQKAAFIPAELGSLLLSVLCIRFTFHGAYRGAVPFLHSSRSPLSAVPPSSTSSETVSASSAAFPLSVDPCTPSTHFASSVCAKPETHSLLPSSPHSSPAPAHTRRVKPPDSHPCTSSSWYAGKELTDELRTNLSLNSVEQSAILLAETVLSTLRRILGFLKPREIDDLRLVLFAWRHIGLLWHSPLLRLAPFLPASAVAPLSIPISPFSSFSLPALRVCHRLLTVSLSSSLFPSSSFAISSLPREPIFLGVDAAFQFSSSAVEVSVKSEILEILGHIRHASGTIAIDDGESDKPQDTAHRKEEEVADRLRNMSAFAISSPSDVVSYISPLPVSLLLPPLCHWSGIEALVGSSSRESD
uniref:Uncharacterized protein n=1 Tax=Toxoplasma gondii COUG TaxID=1074873 RepID=A0A2G8Y136_TOXGO|nr:hypothetical protein TGCOUG_314515 [Toxoplasma gondii COUG]